MFKKWKRPSRTRRAEAPATGASRAAPRSAASAGTAPADSALREVRGHGA